MSKVKRLVPVGTVFGRLTVVKELDWKYYRGGYKFRCFLCRCECGKQKEATLNALQQGTVRSCGCLRGDEIRSRPRKYDAIPGGLRSPEHRTWVSIRGRCSSLPSAKDYDRYYGRGIRICKRWLDSYQAFYYDMGPKPSSKHSIDRIDNDGDYCPENCRWATIAEQAKNRRNNRKLTLHGVTRTISDWAIVTGISRNTLLSRIFQGWTDLRILTQPVRKRSPNKEKLYV